MHLRVGRSALQEYGGSAAAVFGPQWADLPYVIRPEFRQDHPLNLSISISGGKETNQDSPSNGERTGNSPT